MDAKIINPESHTSKHCIACFQMIDSRATVCHQCNTRQTSTNWKKIFLSLKWIGGATALLSLIITLGQINTFLGDWKNSQRNVDIYLESANIQRDTGDYVAAWESYNKVLQIDPGNNAVLDEQFALATVWLESVPVQESSNHYLSKKTQIATYLDALLSALYRGLVTAGNDDEASTIYAHIGLLHLYKYQSRLYGKDEGAIRRIMTQTLEKALLLNPDNDFANIYMAYSRYYFDKEWVSGEVLIRKVEKAVNKNHHIHRIYLKLLSMWAPENYLFTRLLSFSKSEPELPGSFFDDVYDNKFYIFLGSGYHSRLIRNLTILPKKDTLEILRYVGKNVKKKSRDSTLHLMDAFLDELTGKTEDAKKKFSVLHQKVKRNEFIGKGKAEVYSAMKRLEITQ